MKRKGLVVPVLMLTLILFGLSSVGSHLMAYTGEGQKTLILKSGSEGVLDDVMTQTGVRFAERMKQRTNGKIQITHFGSSQLGSWRQMLESLKGGAMGVVVSGMTGSPIYDTLNIPYTFRDPGHAEKVFTGPIGAEFAQKHLEKTGIRIFGFVYRGFRHCTFTKVAVRTPADMKGMKFRVPESPIHLETWRAIGVRPTPMAWGEVYTSLQQGTIDGQENPIELAVVSSLFEVQKYMVLTGHMLAQGWGQTSEKVWESLTPETRRIWMETWNEVAQEGGQEVLKQEAKYMETWKSKGGVIIEPNVPVFREAMKDIWKKFAPKTWGEGVYERIQALR